MVLPSLAGHNIIESREHGTGAAKVRAMLHYVWLDPGCTRAENLGHRTATWCTEIKHNSAKIISKWKVVTDTCHHKSSQIGGSAPTRVSIIYLKMGGRHRHVSAQSITKSGAAPKRVSTIHLKIGGRHRHVSAQSISKSGGGTETVSTIHLKMGGGGTNTI